MMRNHRAASAIRRVFRPALAAALCLLLTSTARADESHATASPAEAPNTDALHAALAQPLLASGEALTELKAFVLPRVMPPPSAPTRAEWEATAQRLRRDMLDQVVFRGTASAWRDAPCRVEWLDTVPGGSGYRIRKFRYEALPQMWIPGLLYMPDPLPKRAALAMHVNGHAPEGKAVGYKQVRSINLAKRGMLVLDLEWFGMGQLRTAGFSHYRMNQLDLCGASGLAPFYLAMSRALDLGLALPEADPARVAVAGLSGGGWQTIMIGALDERITLANPVAGYGDFRTNLGHEDLGDSEQVPTDMAIVADYTHLTALRAPRPTLLTYNAADDCCFQSGHTLAPLLSAARPAFALYGAEDRLRSHVNHDPGTHNFERENREQYYAAIGDYFFPGDRQFIRAEIPADAELKTAEALHVPLPDDNLDFHRLAERLAADLPRAGLLPTDRAAAERWQAESRARLRALLHVPRYDAVSTDEKRAAAGAHATVARRFRLSDQWTVPGLDISSGAPSDRWALLVADAGRTSIAAEAARLAAAGYRVLAVDPMFWGESRIKAQDPDYLFPLYVSAVGERPLGVQAAQLAAIARWTRAHGASVAPTIVGIGPRAGLAALVAAAAEPDAIGAVELTGALSSLKLAIEQDRTVETLPELFAFGLLAEFDVPQLVALAAPLPVTFHQPDERARHDLAALPTWYGLFGHDFRPAP